MNSALIVLVACSVCFSASDENNFAYLTMTIFMSLLPLGAMAAGFYYVWKQMGGGDVFAERPEPPRLVDLESK